MSKGADEVLAGVPANAAGDVDTVCPEQGFGASGMGGVWVVCAVDHVADARVKDGLCAGRGAPVAGARLKGDVDGGSAQGVRRVVRQGVRNGLALGVRLASSGVPAFSQHHAVPHNCRAYWRIGRGEANAFAGFCDGVLHPHAVACVVRLRFHARSMAMASGQIKL